MKIRVFCSPLSFPCTQHTATPLVFPAPNNTQHIAVPFFFNLSAVFRSVAALTYDEDQPSDDIDCGGDGQ